MNKEILVKMLLIFSFLSLIQSNSIKILAQDITDEEVAAIEKKQKIAEARKAIAEAQKAEMDAKFPAPDPSKLVGSTKINEGEFIETRILGYCAMKRAANTIATNITRARTLNTPTTLVLYSEGDIQKITRYKLMMQRLKFLENGYEEVAAQYLAIIQRASPRYNLPTKGSIRQQLVDAAEAKSGRSFGAIVSTALNYLSLMKTDVEITPREFDVSERELVAEVFGRLPGYTLYYPKTIPMTLLVNGSSPLLDQVTRTADAYDKANFLREVATDALINSLNKQLGSLNLNPSLNQARINAINLEKSRLERAKEEIGAGTNQLDKLNQVFHLTMQELGFEKKDDAEKKDSGKEEEEKEKEEIEKTPTTCPEKPCSQTTNVNVNASDKKDDKKEEGGSGNTSFISYLQAESYYQLMQGDSKSGQSKQENSKFANNSYWIDLQVVKAGGNLRVKSNFITNFFLGSRVNFSGGAITYYNVFDINGRSVLSGVVPAYESYRKSSRINDTCQ